MRSQSKRNCVRPYGGGPGSLGSFPYLQYINYITNNEYSNYDSLQATLTQRLSHGLNFTVGYTYGHGLDNGSLNRGNTPQNSLDPKAEYASSDFDIRHRVTVTASYDIPGKKSFGQVLEGWKVNTIVTFQTPWMAFDTGNDFSTGGSGQGDFTDRWDFFGNPNDFKSGPQSIPYCSGFGTGSATCTSTSGVSGLVSALPSSLGNQCIAKAPDMKTLNVGGCFVSGNSVMVPPVAGTYGTMGRNIFPDTGFSDVDFSIFKDFHFKERIGAQFRAEFFNLFNHPNISNPYGASNGSNLGDSMATPNGFGCGCATPDVAGRQSDRRVGKQPRDPTWTEAYVLT